MDYKQLLGEMINAANMEIQAAVREALLHGEESQAAASLAAWEKLLAAQKDSKLGICSI